MVRMPQRGLDLLAVAAGYGLVVWGVSMWSGPGAAVVAGVMLLAGALWRTP